MKVRIIIRDPRGRFRHPLWAEAAVWLGAVTTGVSVGVVLSALTDLFSLKLP